MQDGAILVVETDRGLRESLLRALDTNGYAVCGAETAVGASRIIDRCNVQLVLRSCRINVPQAGGLPQVVMYDNATDAGCGDLAKPFDTAALLTAVTDHLQAATDQLIACDPATCRVAGLASRVAMTDVSVMITGESGVGKEVFAQLIHRKSARSGAPFVALNCAALPATMLEAILFGYEKGAFTGATSAHAGKFEQANGGTLLLDEVTELPLELQGKLLRVLQEREVERLGSDRLLPLDLRIIATSNRNLIKVVSQGLFREDLYYRLNVFPLEIPPLRSRPGDILPLARHLMRRFAQHQTLLSAEAESALRDYSWPGNVRELANVVQRALVLADDCQIDREHLLFDDTGIPRHLNAVRDRSEAREILDTLHSVGGRRRDAAQRLGISPRTLRYKLAKLRAAGHAVPEPA